MKSKIVAERIDNIIARVDMILAQNNADKQDLRTSLRIIKSVAQDAREEITGQKEAR